MTPDEERLIEGEARKTWRQGGDLIYRYIDGARFGLSLREVRHSKEIQSLTENLKALRELSPYSTEPITYTVPSTNYTIRVPAGCVLQQMENGSYSVFMKETSDDPR